MRFELTTSTLAISADLMTPFGKFSNINHNVSRGVACRPVVSRGVPWKVEGWVEDLGFSAWWSVRPLEHQATAALQHLAGDPRSVVACQEHHRSGDILGLAEATEWRLSNHTVRGGADENEIGRVIDAMQATVDTWR